MLLDTIKRHDGLSLMKLVSIEGLRAAGHKIPTKVHSVPAIAFDNANLIFGKQVFDYLLLPGRGLLLTQAPKQAGGDGMGPMGGSGSGGVDGEPLAFTLGAQHSDVFSMLEGSDDHSDKNYAWASVFDNGSGAVGAAGAASGEMAFQEDTRSKKELPDINAIREQRQMDLQQHTENHINIATFTPPTSTRI